MAFAMPTLLFIVNASTFFYFCTLWSFSGKESTKQPTSQKAKAETVAIPKIGDVSRTKMR